MTPLKKTLEAGMHATRALAITTIYDLSRLIVVLITLAINVSRNALGET